jgi:hypothetical protein
MFAAALAAAAAAAAAWISSSSVEAVPAGAPGGLHTQLVEYSPL